ncbi:hypothetical protein DYB37_012075, partial [Aphanomyces astaci]
CNEAKPIFDPPGTRSLINQADHDIAIQLTKNNAVGVGTLRLLLFVSRKLGGNPNELLQPFLGYRDDDSGDFEDGEQPSGDDYGVDGDDNEQDELVTPCKARCFIRFAWCRVGSTHTKASSTIGQ